mmetsp:Transcript_59944/g.147311  ORF Transcript_59944/g.147311 Transcript_59944/m.147311 type:complete len:215 (+) Transcript_59944:275-919(+)
MTQRQKVWRAAPIQHDWRSAHEVPSCVTGWVELLVEKLLVDETGRVLPALWPRVTENVMSLELVGKVGGPLIECGTHQKVVLVSAGKDERDLRRISRVTEDLGRDLHTWCNTGTTGDHVEMFSSLGVSINRELTVGGIIEFSNRSAEINRITNLKTVKVLTHLSSLGEAGRARWVRLDDELHTSNIMVGGDWRVSSYDSFFVDLSRQEHVFASW